MKISRNGIACLSALTLLAWLAPLAAAQSQYAGWIEEIHGRRAYWRQGPQGKQVRLNELKDQYRRLHVGEALRCKHGATVQLRLYGKLEAITEKSGWYQIPEGAEIPDVHYGTPGGRRASVDDNRAFVAQAAMNHYGELRYRYVSSGPRSYGFSRSVGWVDSGPNRIVLSPSGRVLADEVVFRWQPGGGLRVLTLAIQDDNGKLLWQQEGVDGATGELTSESARQALGKYRDEGTTGRLRFVLRTDAGREESVEFSVLSVDEEQALRKGLALWDDQRAVLRHAGRAVEFSDHGMIFEAAQEYQAAQKSAPESVALSDAEIGAHVQAVRVPKIPENNALPAASAPPK
jgi:hypothetical protein